MYCSACGAPVSKGLNYCNRCGNNLSVVRGGGAGKSDESPSAVGIDIFWTTVVGLGLILGGMVALKSLDFREAFIIAYMIVSSLAFLGLFSLDLWRFIRAYRGKPEVRPAARAEELDTKELQEAEVRALPEPVPSVIEHTTRSLEPAYRQDKLE